MELREVAGWVRVWWHRLPRRAVVALAVAAVALGALAWQYDQRNHPTSGEHTGAPAAAAIAPAPSEVPAPAEDLGDTPVEQLAPPTVAADAATEDQARVVVTRFATNFGSPNGNRADWLARIVPDLSTELIEQYRLTDIRNVTQAAVTAVDGPVRREPASVTFDVAYDDGSRIEVRMETGPDGWKAVNVVPLTSDGLPAAENGGTR